MMISCRKAADLTEKQLAGALSWSDGLQLSVHRALCNACRRYGKQAHALHLALKEDMKLPEERVGEEEPPEVENEALKERILKKLG